MMIRIGLATFILESWFKRREAAQAGDRERLVI